MAINHIIPKIYAHRGASGYCIDNTMTSFQKAIEMKTDGIESDVRFTKDQVPFLFHDSTCQLKGNDKKIRVNSLYYRDLARINLPNDENVPTLREFIEAYAGKKAKSGQNLRFSVDVDGIGSAVATAKLARAYDCEDQFEICSKYTPIFAGVRKISERIHLVASNSIRPFTFYTYLSKISKYQKYNVETFNIKAQDYHPEYEEKLRGVGFQMYIWDLHTEKKLRDYLPYKPNAIYSNYPDLALKIRDELFGR